MKTKIFPLIMILSLVVACNKKKVLLEGELDVIKEVSLEDNKGQLIELGPGKYKATLALEKKRKKPILSLRLSLDDQEVSSFPLRVSEQVIADGRLSAASEEGSFVINAIEVNWPYDLEVERSKEQGPVVEKSGTSLCSYDVVVPGDERWDDWGHWDDDDQDYAWDNRVRGHVATHHGVQDYRYSESTETYRIAIKFVHQQTQEVQAVLMTEHSKVQRSGTVGPTCTPLL